MNKYNKEFNFNINIIIKSKCVTNLYKPKYSKIEGIFNYKIIK